jgi:hypothetical protein
MLTKTDRMLVESIKTAKRLKITIGGSMYDDEDGKTVFTFDMRVRDIRKLTHDVALAVQDFVNRANRDDKWKQITSIQNSLRSTGNTVNE